MNWTTERPTKPGWYWWRNAYAAHSAEIIKIENRPPGYSVVLRAGEISAFGPSELTGQFAPIPDPTGARDESAEKRPLVRLGIGDLFGFPSDNKEPVVEVFSQAGAPAFVCGLYGCTSGDMVEQIEKDLNDNRDFLDKGGGQYLYRAVYVPAQIGNEGRVELRAYWDLSLVAFLRSA